MLDPLRPDDGELMSHEEKNDPAFAAFMDAVLGERSAHLPDPDRIADAMLGQLMHMRLDVEQVKRIMQVMPRGGTVMYEVKLEGNRPMMRIIDDFLIDPNSTVTGRMPQMRTDMLFGFDVGSPDKDMTALLFKGEIGQFNPFRIIDLPALVQEEPEPRAKNGAHANRKTVQAKAKLPFYHKNRRF